MTTTEYIAVTGLCLAGYGAILSTTNSVIQFAAHRKERTDIVVKVYHNMVITDAMDKKITLIVATNRGKRPVRVEGFAAKQLDTDVNLLFTDVRPHVPHQLAESESIKAFVPALEADLSGVETYFVYDSLNREFRLHVKPWHRRILSRYRRRLKTQ